jgi:hypothetical protein
MAVASRTLLIGADGPKFVRQAGLFLAGRPHDALAIDYHPLYAALTAGVAAALGLGGGAAALERAGTIVSVVAGSLAAVPVVLLARRLAPEGRADAALAAGLLYAVSPYLARYGADIMSEATYIAFFLGAIAAGVEAVERRRTPLFALAGALAGLAYLARPEGAGAALLVALYALARRRSLEPRQRAAGAAAVLAAFALLALPYMAEIGRGGLVFTQKKSLAAFAGVAPEAADAAADDGEPRPAILGAAPAHGAVPRAAQLAGQVLLAFANAYHPVPLALFAAGLALRARGRARPVEALLLGALLFYLAVLARLRAEWGYADKRHALPLVALTLPVAGLGLVELADRLAARAARLRPALAALAIGALAFGIQLPKTLAAQRRDQLGELAAGRFLRADAERRGIARPVVFTHRDKVAYYAGAEWYAAAPGGGAETIRAALAAGADYVAVRDGRADDFWPGIGALLREPPFVLVDEERDGKGRFLVYFVSRGP